MARLDTRGYRIPEQIVAFRIFTIFSFNLYCYFLPVFYHYIGVIMFFGGIFSFPALGRHYCKCRASFLYVCRCELDLTEAFGAAADTYHMSAFREMRELLPVILRTIA